MKAAIWVTLGIVAFLLLTSGVEWSPDAWRFFPSPAGKEKIILAVVALLTTFAFAYSDSLPRPGHPRFQELEDRRDVAKLLTHGLAINATGYALILTIQGVL